MLINTYLKNLNAAHLGITNCFNEKFYFADDADANTSLRVGIGAVAYVQTDGKVLLGGIDATSGFKNLRRFNPNGTEPEKAMVSYIFMIPPGSMMTIAFKI